MCVCVCVCPSPHLPLPHSLPHRHPDRQTYTHTHCLCLSVCLSVCLCLCLSPPPTHAATWLTRGLSSNAVVERWPGASSSRFSCATYRAVPSSAITCRHIGTRVVVVVVCRVRMGAGMQVQHRVTHIDKQAERKGSDSSKQAKGWTEETEGRGQRKGKREKGGGRQVAVATVSSTE